MNDQRQLWNDAHANQELHAHSLQQTQFAVDVNNAIAANASILELGCGEGNDSIYFAKQRHRVIATDFSDIIVEQNRKQHKHPNLQFKVQDSSQPLDFADNSFDVVYARLSLHYFTDAVTQYIFAEIARVLKNGGNLCFMCKEVSDAIYGQGIEIEPDMFKLDGHVRHFFSEAYARKLLTQSGFTVESIETGKEDIYDSKSAFIKVMAKKAAAR